MKELLLQGNTPLHYCIQGTQLTSASNLRAEETLEAANDRRCKTLERLLFPTAFIIEEEGSKRTSVADLGRANMQGLTALHMAVNSRAEAIVPILLSWDGDFLKGQRKLVTPTRRTGGGLFGIMSSRDRGMPPSQGDGIFSGRIWDTRLDNPPSPTIAEAGATSNREQAAARAVPSLCNLHDPLTGDTTLLACLRAIGEPLRKKDDERTKQEEATIVQVQGCGMWTEPPRRAPPRRAPRRAPEESPRGEPQRRAPQGETPPKPPRGAWLTARVL